MAHLGTKPTKGRKLLAIKAATVPWLARPIPNGANKVSASAGGGGGVTVH